MCVRMVSAYVCMHVCVYTDVHIFYICTYISLGHILCILTSQHAHPCKRLGQLPVGDNSLHKEAGPDLYE